jgi:hypothetical protein
MKFIKTLAAAVFMAALCLSLTAADKEKPKYKDGGCCDKAAKKGETCKHECCVAAAKDGKVCEKCNAPKKDK